LLSVNSCKDCNLGSKQRPLKAGLVSGIGASTLFMAATNPDENSFRSAQIEAAQALMCVPDSIRNPDSERWSDRGWQCNNVGALRHLNLGIATLIWEENASEETGAYIARCQHMRPRWSDMATRTVDIGFLGRWWLLRSNMANYDVNPDEWDEEGRPRHQVEL